MALAIAGLLLAGVIKGATGIGYSSCALPFMAAAFGLKTAVAILVVPAMASNILLVRSAGRVRATLAQFWPLYIATLPGIVAGVGLLSMVDQGQAAKVLGIIIVAYGLQQLASPGVSLATGAGVGWQLPVGLTNGFLTGLTGSQVIPLLPYLMSLGLGTSHFVQAVNLAVITASAFFGACLVTYGIAEPQMLLFSAAAVVPALLGVQIGTWCRAAIDEAKFRRLVVLVLIAIGASLVLR